MSMYLEFDPHSWYMGAAIRDNARTDYIGGNTATHIQPRRWSAYIEDGMVTYSVIELHAHTLAELKSKIKEYRGR